MQTFFAENIFSTYFCAQMEKHLTMQQAWDDFLQVVYPNVEGRKKRMDIIKALSDQRRGLLGARRIRRILEKYAPDRYTFHESVTING